MAWRLYCQRRLWVVAVLPVGWPASKRATVLTLLGYN